jgi:hypothetical protein
MRIEKHHQSITRLRNQSLSNILTCMEAQRDRNDKCKWHTTRGILTITGTKFFNRNTDAGGGGAIDLIIHLKQCSFNEALKWLDHFASNNDNAQEGSDINAATTDKPTTLSHPAIPTPSISLLPQVKTYLIQERRLPLSLRQPHIHNGTLYADARANAVFLLHSPDSEPVGAELRGSTAASWRGLARGTRKDQGYFSTPPTVIEGSPVILCESAIDAISCSVMHPGHHCISTAGARANPAWLGALLVTGRIIYCGYDNDATGGNAAQTMISSQPTIRRRRPARHDWNEDLKHQL